MVTHTYSHRTMDNQWEYIQSDDSNSTYIMPRIHLHVTEKKYDLFEKSNYVQLVELIVRSKIPTNRNNKRQTRGVLYLWLKKKIDLSSEKSKGFLEEKQKTLLKLKNKRQLLLFLNRNFNHIHDLKSWKTHNHTSGSPDVQNRTYTGTKRCAAMVYNLFCVTLLSLILVVLIIYIFKTTDKLEACFIKDPNQLSLIKSIKPILFAVL